MPLYQPESGLRIANELAWDEFSESTPHGRVTYSAESAYSWAPITVTKQGSKWVVRIGNQYVERNAATLKEGKARAQRTEDQAATWPQTDMVVIDTDQLRGRYYKCRCGWRGWSAWGHAKRHHTICEKAAIVP